MTVRQGPQGPATTVRATVVAGPRGRTSAVARRVRDGVAAVRWYVRQVMGDDAYATYAAHQRAVHPGGVVMTEREFWRMRHAEQDANPGSRCC
ncbi:YbdD/YjiX family protein [Cellulosimicrobium sp. NPDC057862]|uniref:YbdD/YjiX family protein n=1 Tax=Cellulosimicrobium sp. NPDC057862 TaxID=3346266 RepID=UPI00366ADF74